MRGLKKISTRIFFGIFTGTLIVFSVSNTIDYLYTRNIISGLLRNLVENSFKAAYSELDARVVPIINNSENSAYYLGNYKFAEDEFLDIQRKIQSRFEGNIGCCIARFDKVNGTFFAQYISEDTIISSINHRLTASNIEALKRFRAKESGYPIEITLQKDTLSFYYNKYGSSNDICVRNDFMLQEFVALLDIQSSIMPSRHYLFDENLKALRSSTKKYIEIDDTIQDKEIGIIRGLIIENKKGLAVPGEIEFDRAVYISNIVGTKLTVASTIEIHGILKRFRFYIIVSFLISVIAMLVLAYVLQKIIVRLTRPISDLTSISKKIQEGSLNATVPEYNGDDESAILSDALRSVQGRMKNYVSNLNTTLKEKRALEHELKIANKIQTDMIPLPDRALTELPEVDLYARMKPAKGIAGDFYDYFFLDENRLFFVIGDVSGKGIPAALFMVKAITIIELAARNHDSPAEIFRLTNEQLCAKNEEGMFVTAIAGIINISTGELALCDAGHNTPIMNLNNARFEYTELEKGMPLGIMPSRTYKNTNYKLSKYDTLLFYTDGFTECIGKSGTMLGEEALLKSIQEKDGNELNAIAKALWFLINNFRQDTPASDDTTLLLLRYLGK